MRFLWSEAKRQTHLKDHGLDFADTPRVFDGVEVDRFDYGEQRFVTLGRMDGIVVSIVHTESPRAIRVISFRKATKHEQAIFFRSVKD